jgi:flagellar motor switch protein FliM
MVAVPYKLRLRKVSRREQAVLDAVYAYLPGAGLERRFTAGVRKALSDALGRPCSLRLETALQESYSAFLGRLHGGSLLAIVGMPPASGRIVCEIDSQIAIMAVERILGGEAQQAPEPRAISDTEQGILQYLILKVLEGAHEASGGSERVLFRFEGFEFGADGASGLADGARPAAVLAYRITIGRHAGFVRLALPKAFVDSAMLAAPAPGEARALEQGACSGRIERFGYVRVPVWAEAGRSAVFPADLAQLEEGDVVLLEQGDMALSGGREGKAVIRVGRGMASGMDAEVRMEADRARCTIVGIHRGA